MIGLLIITHETLGAAYRTLSEHIFPQLDRRHIRLLAVSPADSHDHVIERAHALLPELDGGHGVLILTDIFGATPCNAAMKLIRPTHTALLTGLNAPMLIKAVSHAPQANDLAHFAHTVREAAVSGIMLWEQPLQAA